MDPPGDACFRLSQNASKPQPSTQEMTVTHTLTEPQLLQALNWRYATKAFDPHRKIATATWHTLQEALMQTV